MKNRNMMKKFFALAAACAMACSLAACSNSAGQQSQSGASNAPASTDVEISQSTGETYTVAIIKQMDHPSLDEIATAIETRLTEIAGENGVTIQYTTTSGQGDQTVLVQLADQAIADGVDAIIPIASTAAQVAAVSAEDTGTPVVYAAVSDPATAELTGMDYVTGTSDGLNTQLILDMMLAQTRRWRRWACSIPCLSPTRPPPLPRQSPIWTAKASPTLSRPPPPTTR